MDVNWELRGGSVSSVMIIVMFMYTIYHIFLSTLLFTVIFCVHVNVYVIIHCVC